MVGADNVRAMLGRLIREESLRTYLFTYAHVYASLSLRSLADMFELPRQRVHSLVSKMIINEELLASLDDPSECAILHRSEPTRMQALALQLADKVNYTCMQTYIRIETFPSVVNKLDRNRPFIIYSDPNLVSFYNDYRETTKLESKMLLRSVSVQINNTILNIHRLAI